MREREKKKSAPASDKETTRLADVKKYFTSFYKSTVRDDTPCDRHTIPGITEVETRFHYNATENSIIRALLHHEPLPPGAELWHMMQQRKEWRVLDIGSGTGHWIDFYRNTFFATHVTGIEIVDDMADYLQKKYKDIPAITILQGDISQDDFTLAEPFDVINAIGVMFHIVDDNRWRTALSNLAALTKPGGLLVMGGDFGDTTYNDQFHKRDEFDSWQEHDALDDEEGIVNKRLRSLSMWQDEAASAGLTVIETVRSDSETGISTPENDVLLLQKPA